MASDRRYVSRLVPDNLKILLPLLVAVAVVNSATLGYDSSMMNGLLILPSYSEYFSLTTTLEGLNNAAMWMGGILGSFCAQPLPDVLGRRRAILVGCLVTIVGIVLQAAAQHIAMFVVSRILVGVGAAIANLTAPTLLGELLAPKGRARVLGLFYSCYFVGSLASSIVNYGSQNIDSTWAWRLPSLLQIIPSFLALGLLPFIPESPRWLLANQRDQEAIEVLAIMQGRSDSRMEQAEQDARNIKVVLVEEAVKYAKNPWQDITSGKANRRRLVILISFGTMINMFGNFIISYYLTRILDQAGITNTKTQTQIQVIINCWSFAVAIFGSFMLDILGRRTQLLVSVSGMVTTLCLIGGLIKRYGSSHDTSGTYGTIAVIFLFQGFYAFAITPMTSLYATEIAPYKLRTTAIAIFRAFDSGFGLLASFVMPFAMQNLGWRFYFINAAWDFAFLVLVYFVFIETKGLKLEAIAAKIGDDVPAIVGIPVEMAQDKVTITNYGKGGE